MADTKISALTAIDAVADGDEFAANDVSASASKKVSASQIATYVGAELFGGITGVVRSDAGTLAADTDVTDIVSAASDTAAGKIEIANQAEMEAGSDTARAVTPGRQHFHPSAAKFWVQWTGNSTTILSSFNMTSIADTAVGDADGTIGTDFSSADWAASVDTRDTTTAWDAANVQGSGFNAKAAGTFGVLCSTITDGGTAVASLTDPDEWCVLGFGDHA
jgi:hypothetical protein